MMAGHAEREKSTRGPYVPLVILHGGAGSITRAGLPPSLYQLYHASLKSYLESTQALLEGASSSEPRATTNYVANAVEAAVHAVSLFEEDPLFNCGHGSVFTTSGEVQMEASLAVSSIHDPIPSYLPGHVKRSAAVSMITQTRHPIQLARLILEMADGPETLSSDDSRQAGADAEILAEVRRMHGHLSGDCVEQLGFSQGLERKPRSWFWTRKRWDEHRRGLGLTHSDEDWKQKLASDVEPEKEERGGHHRLHDRLHNLSHKKNDKTVEAALESLSHHDLPSQGTVGAVCMDSWGNLAVATSTGGLTNKRPGRIGDTPTVGAGFWAESWKENIRVDPNHDDKRHLHLNRQTVGSPLSNPFDTNMTALARSPLSWFQDCLPFPSTNPPSYPFNRHHNHTPDGQHRLISAPPDSFYSAAASQYTSPHNLKYPSSSPSSSSSSSPTSPPNVPTQTRALALSGTGNGDSFLRTALARTTASMIRFHNAPAVPASSPSSDKSISPPASSLAARITLSTAVTAAAGPNGLLQRSAETRSGSGGEGEGGMIGIEAVRTPPTSRNHSVGEKSGKVDAEVVFDFNCGGMWRAWFVDEDEGGGGGGGKDGGGRERKRVAKVMVFRQEY